MWHCWGELARWEMYLGHLGAGTSMKPWLHQLGGAPVWMCTLATFWCRTFPFCLESQCLVHMEIWVYRVLWDEKWLVKYYSVADGWVEKAYKIHPFICIHAMLHFIRLHATSKLFHGSKFNSCCQDCLLWAGYNWQHLFSFLPNKIIRIFPAEEKWCGYSFRTADCLAHKAHLGSASQEKTSITTCVAKLAPKPFVFAMAQW